MWCACACGGEGGGAPPGGGIVTSLSLSSQASPLSLANFLRTHKAPQYRLFSSHDCIPWYFILFKLLFKQSSPRDSQFVTVRGERKLACRDGADLVCRRVLLARERGDSNTLLGDQRVTTAWPAQKLRARKHKT